MPPAKPPIPPNLPVKHIDKFAERWIASLPNKGVVFSPTGLWPLLAILADAATDDVRASLLAAIAPSSTPAPHELTDSALALLKYLENTDGVAILAGVWARYITFRPEFVAGLPAGTCEVLTGDLEADKAALKAWADKVLKGLLSFKVGIQDNTTAYLASAVVMDTRWWDEFYRTDSGWLTRSMQEEGTVRSSSDVTTVCIRGGNDDIRDDPASFTGPAGLGEFDVHLVLGPKGLGPSRVLAKGLAAIRGAVDPLTVEGITEAATPPRPGPGLNIKIFKSDDAPHLVVDIRPRSFHVTAKNQLDLAVCGLPEPGDRHDFPGMAIEPTVIQRVTQRAMAEFTSMGFTAAALSEVDGVMGSFRELPPEPVKSAI